MSNLANKKIAAEASSAPRKKTPKTAPRREAGYQAKKSAATQKLIVESALQCIIKNGYAKTTTPSIAKEANVSRGAMVHHFSNRLSVIKASIEYLHQKRLRAFRRAVTTLPDDKPHLHDALVAYWKHVTHPLFVAFHELAVASRTDKQLKKILQPAQEEFYREWYNLAVEMFPEWQSNRDRFNVALNLVQATLEGMANARLTGAMDKQAEEALIDYLEECLRALMPEIKGS